MITDVLIAMLMNGVSVEGKRDLPLGSVYGVWFEPDFLVGTHVWYKSNAPIGTASPGSFDFTRTHK